VVEFVITLQNVQRENVRFCDSLHGTVTCSAAVLLLKLKPE